MSPRWMLVFVGLIVGAEVASAAAPARGVPRGCDPSVMSEAYWNVWNEETQAALDAEIERNRKADAVVALPVEDGTEVSVEQLKHEFVFGAHIFNFNQLGRKEWNDAYKRSYGRDGIFNSATVAFYWEQYEPNPGAYRADGDSGDTERFWNALTIEESQRERFWRRPAPGPVIEYCKQAGIRVHGHILVWGLAQPHWIWNSYCPEGEKLNLAPWGIPRYNPISKPHNPKGLPFKRLWREAWLRVFNDLSEEEIAALAPEYVANLKRLFRQRVAGVAARFGDLVDSWDVVNESSQDWAQYRTSRSGKPVCASRAYGLMPGDYQLDALLEAKRDFPARTKLNINDWNITGEFLDQVRDLEREGAKIDIVGCQMHIFDTNICMKLANGATSATECGWAATPELIRARLDMMAKTGKPIHVSEVTISATGTEPRDRQIQAILARNIYRCWFAHPATMGVTWWNTVDGGGVSGEPLVSGLFTRDLQRKPAYEALDELINGEWRTSVKLPVADGKVAFRGFRGDYRLSWRCKRCGERHERFVTLGKDGATGADVRTACNLPIRSFVVDGKRQELKDGETVLDLKRIYPDAVVAGRDGERWATVEFTLTAPADGEYELLRLCDWYGEWKVNGESRGTINGPSQAVEKMRLRLGKGENRIEVRTRSGCGGRWLFSILLPRESPLR